MAGWIPRWNRTPKKEEQDDYAIALDRLLAFRQPGETFNYLGRKMLVTCIEREDLGYGVYLPKLQCWYADDKGELHSVTFGTWDLKAMEAEQRVAALEREGEKK